ncbi:uncharacterized protein LOC121865955 [Homarus americanus]|uniref:uncharacterized protein LOC121865955 n=1 Tax=Homarus americanus TaxID=6706 RepID=UPI001C497815|nr:uncharacterized protein LOC121865955 [Homarus americanus]
MWAEEVTTVETKRLHRQTKAIYQDNKLEAQAIEHAFRKHLDDGLINNPITKNLNPSAEWDILNAVITETCSKTLGQIERKHQDWFGENIQEIDVFVNAPLVAVYAVRGQTAQLPCNLTTAPEDPVILVLWYKNGTKTPVFSVDSRTRGHHQQEGSGSMRASDAFGGRATFQEHRRWSWALVVREVEFSDQGEYRCRLDFQSSPTHNARVLLHVVDLPRHLRIYSSGGALVEDVASVEENHPLTLSCRAAGGEPLPNVTWWSGSTLLDSEVEERQEGITSLATPSTTPAAPYVTNTLHVAAVTRAHLTHNLTCTAANTPALPPLSASVLLQETDSELEVTLTKPGMKLSGGRQYDIRCEASGVRPPPVLTWWLRGQHLTHNIHVQTLGLDSTVSLMRLLATAGDDGGLLECRAAAPTLPHLTATDSIRLTVHYVPEASISIEGGGGQGRATSKVGGVGGVGGLRAGDSATLTCAARANPPAYNFTFLFNGRPLHRANIVESKPTLTLLQLDYRDGGLYTCLASNSEGDGQSNAVGLHIDYAPVCEWEGAREVLAVVGEKVEIECRVRASPPQVTYTWESVTYTSNMDQIRSPLHHGDEGLTSVGWAVADNTTSGTQRAECQPSNEVGPADRPCLFTILLVDEPSELIGCFYHDVTTDSAGVTCSPDVTTSQLKQTYHIEVREGSVVVAAYNNTEPRFNLTSLAPGRDYVLAMFASHAKGRGHQTTLLMKTHTPKAEQVAPERVSVNSVKTPSEETPPPTESPRNNGGTPVSVVVSGVVVGVVVGVAVVVAGVVTCRARRSQSSSPGKAHQYHNASRNSLLELPQSAVYQSCTSHLSHDLLTTFAPGPVVVTQVTSARSSKRPSPLLRKSSTRSAPGGTSPRGMRPRSASCRGGPVHVVEVEADDITTPRVEIQSPTRMSRLSLQAEAFKLRRESPPRLSIHREPLQQKQPEPQADPLHHPLASPQGEVHPDPPQLHATSQVHLSPQSFSVAPQHVHPSTQSRLSPQPYDAVTQQHLHPQVHTVTLPHTIPQITLTPQAHTATLPQNTSQGVPTSQSHTGDVAHTSSHLHTSTLPRPGLQKYGGAPKRSDSPGRSSPVTRTGTPPHNAGIAQITSTLPRNSTLLHTDSLPHINPIPHTATLPHTATHSHPRTHGGTHTHTGTRPYTGTLSRLASQVHSPAQDYSSLQQQSHLPSQHLPGHHLPQSPTGDPQVDQSPHLSPHPHMEAPPTIHCSSPERASIKLYPTFR